MALIGWAVTVVLAEKERRSREKSGKVKVSILLDNLLVCLGDANWFYIIHKVVAVINLKLKGDWLLDLKSLLSFLRLANSNNPIFFNS